MSASCVVCFSCAAMFVCAGYYPLQALERMERTAEKLENPLFRCFDREINAAKKLLEDIHADILEVLAVCSGKSKVTNHSRNLMECVKKGAETYLL